MDLIYWKAVVLGLVEGLTEFLPISSTGHLILAAALLDFNDAKGQIFHLVIQTGFGLRQIYQSRLVQAGAGRDCIHRRWPGHLMGGAARPPHPL